MPSYDILWAPKSKPSWLLLVWNWKEGKKVFPDSAERNTVKRRCWLWNGEREFSFCWQNEHMPAISNNLWNNINTQCLMFFKTGANWVKTWWSATVRIGQTFAPPMFLTNKHCSEWFVLQSSRSTSQYGQAVVFLTGLLEVFVVYFWNINFGNSIGQLCP